MQMIIVIIIVIANDDITNAYCMFLEEKYTVSSISFRFITRPSIQFNTLKYFTVIKIRILASDKSIIGSSITC